MHIELRDGAGSDDEDFEGSGDPPAATLLPSSRPSSPASLLKIPIQCHYEPDFSIGGGAGGGGIDDDNVMDTVELSMKQIELYHMEIHRNKEWTLPVASSDLSKSMAAPAPAQVVFDETLYVRTWIDGGTARTPLQSFHSASPARWDPTHHCISILFVCSFLHPDCNGEVLGV